MSAESPSLIVCGSQIGVPDAAHLHRLWSSLAHDVDLGTLRQEVAELPELWPLLLERQPSLGRVAGAPVLRSLAEWAATGNSAALRLASRTSSRNTLLAVLTVLAHILEYTTYLNHHQHDHGRKEWDAYTAGLTGVHEGGIQGLCIGLLSAAALACSQSKAEVAKNGAIAMRLALCVGAWIDLDEAQSAEPSVSLAVRWSTGEDEDGEAVFKAVLESSPKAYITVNMDVCSATVTAPGPVASSLIRQLKEIKGFMATKIDLQGRFHHPDHHTAFQRAVDFCASLPMLQFPRPLVPLRRNDSGEVAVPVGADGAPPLHETVLRCILVEKADWHTTMTNSVTAIAQSSKPRRVLLLGPVDCVPHSLLLATSPSPSPLQVIRPWMANSATTTPEQRLYSYPEHAIAVIGTSCRFPASSTPEQFWDTIRAKRSTMGPPPESRGYPGSLGATSAGDRSGRPFQGNFIADAGSFDHAFFKKSPREAAYMDPQHRIALEIAYETVESSGYFSPSSAKTDNVGCYMGISSDDYQANVDAHAPTAFSFTGTARAFAPGRISNFFGWTGPHMAIDTACASSAVAIHAAAKAVQSGECAMALAGGVNLMTSPRSHENLAAASFLSPRGLCRAFDAGADGYSRGDGGGLVLLKRLSAAVADNDPILGVLVGSAVNSGKGSVSITVPSSDSQTGLYQRVLESAGMLPMQVSYIEAHGTGTQKGDPVEIKSIQQVFGRRKAARPLRVGSVKGNVGHSEAASGVSSLIKVLMMMRHGQIPPQASFSKPNPALGSLEEHGLQIPLSLQPWHESFRAACVNNYGASGDNAAMVVCQPPPVFSTKASICRTYPFLVAAHSAISLRQNCRALVGLIAAQQQLAQVGDDALLASIAFHLAQHQNHDLSHRKTFSACSIDELRACLEDDNSQAIVQAPTSSSKKPVVLLFAGQTGHRVRVSEEAYHNSLLLRKHLDHCDRTLQSLGLKSLFPQIFGTDPIDDMVDLHSMLFSLQYASAMAWIDAGMEVKGLVGHSLGQLTAVCVAGVLSLHDGLKMVSGRAKLIQTKWGPERGCMLSVDSDTETVEAMISQYTAGDATDGYSKVEIACYNSSSSHIVVGSEAAVAGFEDVVRARGVSVKRLAVTHGFHSEMVHFIMDEYRQLLQGITFHPPTIPLEACSKYAGSWDKVTPELVAQQSREPVYFRDAISRVEQRLGNSCVWIEAGSGPIGVTMARRALGDSNSHTFHSVRLHTADPIDSLAATTLGLWNEGVAVQFWPFHASQRACFAAMQLPSYQFEKNHHWLSLPDLGAKTDTAAQLQHNSAKHRQPLRRLQPTTEQGVPQLVSFVGYMQDETAEFSINQHSDEYSTFVQGRTVLGHLMTPGSVWLESAARALRLLSPTSSSVSAQAQQVKLHAPFGLDLNRRLRLTMRQQGPNSASWEFVVSSHPLDRDASRLKLQASGMIRWEEQDHKLGPQMRMLHRLVDHDRPRLLRQDPDASVVQGAFVRKVLGRVCNYSDSYFGIRSILSKGLEAVGHVAVPAIAASSKHETMFSPLVWDNFLLVAELHACNLDDCAGDQVYICDGVDAAIPYAYPQAPDSETQGPWTVYSKLHRGSDGSKSVVSDIFVFNARNSSLALVILGAGFAKVPIRSLQRTLDAVNNGAAVLVQHAKQIQPAPALALDPSEMYSWDYVPTAATGSPIALPTPPAEQQEELSKTDDRSLLQVQSIAKGLLQEITSGVSSDTINDATRLGDLGVDSLSATDLQARIRDVFHVDVPVQHFFDQDMAFGKLCQEIESKLDQPPGGADAAAGVSSPGIRQLSQSSESTVSSTTRAPSPASVDAHDREQLIVRLSDLLGEHLNWPTGTALNPDTPLGAMGLDSLVAMQLTSDMEAEFGKRQGNPVMIDPESTFADLCSMIMHPVSVVGSVGEMKPKALALGGAKQHFHQDVTEIVSDGASSKSGDLDGFCRAPSAFIAQAPVELENVKLQYGALSQETGFAGFYSNVYDKQSSLVIAYITEAFSALGCDLKSLQAGDTLPTISYLAKHQKLVSLYYRMLEDAGLVVNFDNKSGFSRTARPLPQGQAKAADMYRDILAEFPAYRPDHLVLNVVASRLADCLSGRAEALQLLFHDKAARLLLEDVYASSPMFATGTKVLGDFVQRLLPSAPGGEKLRVLEIGAGTGGTTHHVLAKLLASKVDFSYTFTDISSSLVARARRTFEARYGPGIMEYTVLDLEKPPPAHMQGVYHLVISSNCVHATRGLQESCDNIQKLLRPDGGMMCLLELTRPLGWLDCVFGLLEGWWRFEDERTYVLADEHKWKRHLLNAGFATVDWSDDESRESDQFRLIMALNVEV